MALRPIRTTTPTSTCTRQSTVSCAGRPKSSPACSRTAYRSSLCSKDGNRASERNRRWTDWRRGVGRGAAPDGARLAGVLLANRSDLPADHRQYLMAAGMAGYLAQGKRAEAGALRTRYPKDADKTKDVGLRLLYAHA